MGPVETASVVLENFCTVTDRMLTGIHVLLVRPGRNEEHGTGHWRTIGPLTEWLKTWLNCVLLSSGKQNL